MARKLHRQIGISLDDDEAEELDFRRLDDPTLNISHGFEATSTNRPQSRSAAYQGRHRRTSFASRHQDRDGRRDMRKQSSG
jgi:hypothetical protein